MWNCIVLQKDGEDVMGLYFLIISKKAHDQRNTLYYYMRWLYKVCQNKGLGRVRV